MLLAHLRIDPDRMRNICSLQIAASCRKSKLGATNNRQLAEATSGLWDRSRNP